MNNKKDMLNYGLKKGYFTSEEYGWCMNGKNINDLSEKIEKRDIEKFTRRNNLMLEIAKFRSSSLKFHPIETYDEDYKIYEPFLKLNRG